MRPQLSHSTSFSPERMSRITTDGSETRKYVGDDHSPLRNSIICILDD